MKVLVKEKIADSGIDLLRESFDVDLGFEMSDEELREAIGSYDAILVRSATQLNEDLIGRADNSRSSAAPEPGSTTSTSPPPPGAGSSSPTLPNRTRSPPPSTPWR